jgi:hypothetical protein
MRKQHLYNVFVALTESDNETAKTAFAQYLEELSKKVLGSDASKNNEKK